MMCKNANVSFDNIIDAQYKEKKPTATREEFEILE